MSRTTIAGFIATSHPLSVYGGVRLSPDVMEMIADNLRTSRYPFAYEHDQRFDADIQLLKVEEEFAARGVGGFSIAVIEPIKKALADDDRPRIGINADSAHFDDSTILGAAGSLESHFAVDAGRLYQFSVIPPAKVAIEMAIVTLQAVPPGLISASLYDALKTWLLHPKKAPKTVFHFRFHGQGDHVQAHIETDDADVVKEALSSIRDVVLASHLGEGHEFDTPSRRWKKYR